MCCHAYSQWCSTVKQTLLNLADCGCKSEMPRRLYPAVHTMVKVRISSSEPPLVAPGDVWAPGVIFHEALTATCQRTSLFMPDTTSLEAVQAAKDLSKLDDAVHALVDAEQDTWVSSCTSDISPNCLRNAVRHVCCQKQP